MKTRKWTIVFCAGLIMIMLAGLTHANVETDAWPQPGLVGHPGSQAAAYSTEYVGMTRAAVFAIDKDFWLCGKTVTREMAGNYLKNVEFDKVGSWPRVMVPGQMDSVYIECNPENITNAEYEPHGIVGARNPVDEMVPQTAAMSAIYVSMNEMKSDRCTPLSRPTVGIDTSSKNFDLGAGGNKTLFKTGGFTNMVLGFLGGTSTTNPLFGMDGLMICYDITEAKPEPDKDPPSTNGDEQPVAPENKPARSKLTDDEIKAYQILNNTVIYFPKNVWKIVGQGDKLENLAWAIGVWELHSLASERAQAKGAASLEPGTKKDPDAGFYINDPLSLKRARSVLKAIGKIRRDKGLETKYFFGADAKVIAVGASANNPTSTDITDEQVLKADRYVRFVLESRFGERRFGER